MFQIFKSLCSKLTVEVCEYKCELVVPWPECGLRSKWRDYRVLVSCSSTAPSKLTQNKDANLNLHFRPPMLRHRRPITIGIALSVCLPRCVLLLNGVRWAIVWLKIEY